jgi:hypothetical protein
MMGRERVARVLKAALVVLSGWLVLGCAGTQIHSTSEHRVISLKPGELREHGIAFITPSTVTGQEEEKQSVALTFAGVLATEMPGTRCVALPETLSAVNQNGLADDYRSMYADYRDTGIFRQPTLKKVGEVTGARYIGQLKLAGFTQGSNTRFGALGFRIVETQFAKVRLFFQIWDSANGTIAWEGMQELVLAEDGMSEKGVPLKTVLEQAARELIRQLPDGAPQSGTPSAEHALPATAPPVIGHATLEP